MHVHSGDGDGDGDRRGDCVANGTSVSSLEGRGLPPGSGPDSREGRAPVSIAQPRPVLDLVEHLPCLGFGELHRPVGTVAGQVRDGAGAPNSSSRAITPPGPLSGRARCPQAMRSLWRCWNGRAAPSSSVASRTSGKSASALPADHVGLSLRVHYVAGSTPEPTSVGRLRVRMCAGPRGVRSVRSGRRSGSSGRWP